jgi:hypothetical protein
MHSAAFLAFHHQRGIAHQLHQAGPAYRLKAAPGADARIQPQGCACSGAGSCPMHRALRLGGQRPAQIRPQRQFQRQRKRSAMRPSRSSSSSSASASGGRAR